MESCDRQPKASIHPALDGKRDDPGWRDAGCLVPGNVRSCLDDRHPCACLYYGTNSDCFYLRFEFRDAIQPTRDLPAELHLLWFYPGVTMYNSPAPLTNLPGTAPLNYLFHHHLGIRLADASCWFEEADARYQWHQRHCQARIAFQDCLDVAVPWSSFPEQANHPLRLVAVFADSGCFRSYLPEGQLVSLQIH